MAQFKVAVLASISDDAKSRLEESAEIVPTERLAEADGVYLDSEVRVDAAFLDSAPRVKAIATKSVGYDLVDVAELERRGIPFSNTKGSLNEAVADLVFCLVVMIMRNLSHDIDWARSGKWMKDQPPLATDPFGKTLGIIGLGGIGSAIARRARAAGMEIAYYNRSRRPDDGVHGARYLPFDDLLRQSDCIVVMIPLNANTKGMFGAREFGLMKKTAFFVNGARGRIVDTNALVEALEQKKIAGAAMDVTDPEPLPPDHPLYKMSNVIITPHIASATHETRNRMAVVAVENLIAGLRGEPMPNAIVVSSRAEAAKRP